jgi:hypothetical protein
MTTRPIPQHTRYQLDEYVTNRIPPGGFVWAVLSNNLEVACRKADDANRAAFFEIVAYVFNELPISCRGSNEAVLDWLRGGPR